VGQLFASPTDLVKIRLQVQRREQSLDPNYKIRYKGTIDAFKVIFKEEGLAGLWKGVAPNVQRAALVNLGELATYDQAKDFLLSTGSFTRESIITHTIASVMSGYDETVPFVSYHCL
jgi:solute carrier family 25 uncoupling protein 27